MRRMHLPAAVLGRLSAGILAVIIALICLAGSLYAAEDTGTYRINDYIVTLEPQNNGQVQLTIEQEWEVLSGAIPWVTVGLPNNNYTIRDYDGDLRSVSTANSGSWSGVRVDLDRSYQPGETFNITFTVLQRNLIERLTDEDKWRIAYTPGWYDRAAIGNLEIRLVSPVSPESYITLDPSPTSTRNDGFTWVRTNLSPGARYTVTTESMDGTFLDADADVVTGGGFNYTYLIIIAIIIGGGLLVWWMVRIAKREREAQRIRAIELEMAEDDTKREEIEKGFEKYVDEKGIEPDNEGRYFDRDRGAYVTPAIWAAMISTHYYRPYIQPHVGSGRGSNYNSSCVSCACVSCACACACACAGGGAAGCSRKTVHECPRCREDETENAIANIHQETPGNLPD